MVLRMKRNPLCDPLDPLVNTCWCISMSFPILNVICLFTQAQAEETLNTLHFASMALRVKCNPLCILDPQDKLVLNLRGTISKLRSQNQQLSTALQRSRSHSGDGSDRDPDFEHEPVSVLIECNPDFEHELVSVLFECDPDFEHELECAV